MADTTGRVLAAPQRASKIRCWPSATLGKPETFDFLGFTHCCSTKRNGDFQVLRLTAKKRMRATLLAIRDELQRRRVMSPSGLKGSGSIGWLAAISTTTRCRATCFALTVFGQLSGRLWRQALKRRSQRNRLQWSRFGRLADLSIPKPRTAHPYPEERVTSLT